MGNVPLFPAHTDNPETRATELKQAIREPRQYMCLDPLPKYHQDEDFLAKLAKTKGRLTRSAMEPKVKPKVSIDPDDSGFSVEAILNKRFRQKKLEYLVKWECCPEEACTWEPAEHLKPFPELTEEFERVWLAKRLETKRKNIPAPGPGRGWNSRRRAAKTAREAKRRKREAQPVEPAEEEEEVFRFQ